MRLYYLILSVEENNGCYRFTPSMRCILYLWALAEIF